MADLLPCPFCGSTEVKMWGGSLGGFVECLKCNVGGPYSENKGEAIAAWNRRAPGWQPIATAPDDGTPIDLWVPLPTHEMGGRRFTDCQFYDGGWDHKFYLLPRDPSHWMPIPDGPEGE